MAEAFRLSGNININVNQAVEDMNRIRTEASNTQSSLNSSFSKFGDTMTKVGKGLSNFGTKLTVGVSTPLIATGGYFISAASDAQEMQSKFDTVFKTTSTQANKWSEEYAKAIGRSNTEIKSAISNQSDLMIGMGFSEDAALDLSQKYTQLAYDLGSFNNVNDATAIEAMTKAMFGETEMAKQLGLNLNVTTMEQSEYVKSLGKSWKELTQAEKAEAYYQVALEQSVNALGDAERTKGSYANMTKRLKGEITNLAESFGTLLLPKATEIVSKITEAIEKFASLDEGTKQNILTIGGLLIAIGPVIMIIGNLIMFIGNCITAFTTISTVMTAAGGVSGIFTLVLGGLSSAFAFITGPIGLVIGAIGLFIAAIVDAYKNNEDFRNKVNEVFNNIKSIVSNVMTIVKDVISIAWSAIKLIWDNGLKQILQVVGSVLTNIVGYFTSKLNTATSIVKNVITLIKAIFSGDFRNVQTIVNKILMDIVQGFNDKMNSARDKVKSAIDKIKGFFNFSWSLPKIKLPHINISGEFSLLPPKAPKFSIDWYSSGAIFTKPTVLGGIGVGDANNGMGDGPEAILPIGHLRQYVREEVQGVLNNIPSNDNSDITALLRDILIYIKTINPSISLDGKQLTNMLAPHSDTVNGERLNLSERGLFI